MLKVSQFRNKLKTHGTLSTLLYSAEFVVRPALRKLYTEPIVKSYSERYEDVIIDGILGNKNRGVYLDIGAYDPHRLSNTKRFYDRGWRGCNIEPNPTRFERFVRARPDDVNLNAGISNFAGKQVFFEAEHEYLSTFSEERARELRAMGEKIRRKVEVAVITMADVFVEHLKGATVDFCSIDTEGMDLVILKNNDWRRFRPRVICVEVSLSRVQANGNQRAESVESFLASVGYKKQVETIHFGAPLNQIFISEDEPCP
jgi:FkbM family methyltransferase